MLEIESTNFGILIPASIALFAIIFILVRNKRAKKPISEQEVDARISAFQPKPLIDDDCDNDDSDTEIEMRIPDETNPECMNLAKVNYLNLLNSEDLKKEAASCIRAYGVGSCGPRGFYGTIDVHLTLESRLAEFMGMEEAILYSYGFSTVASAIGAYCKKSDFIFCDEHINFAARQGMLAARSTIVYFQHNDMEDLESKLKEYEVKEQQKKKLFRKFLVVEGIYDATGTICPLPTLMKLREQYKLRIFVDESISFGVLGKTGRGVTEHFNIDRTDVDMIVGSLEGSVGSIGGFCVGASVVIEHQRLSGLGYCFSASLPPFLSHVAVCAIDIFEKDPAIFQKLEAVSVSVDKELRSLDAYVVISNSISPLKVIALRNAEIGIPNINKILAFCAKQNIYMLCLEENLRFNVNISLEDSDIQKIVTVLKEAALNFT